MSRRDLEEHIVRSYERDERMMVLIFAQWCVNHDLDPAEVYRRAYPRQADNDELRSAIELTLPKEEAGDIPDETLLGVLSVYGNDDLAFVVVEEIRKRAKRRS